MAKKETVTTNTNINSNTNVNNNTNNIHVHVKQPRKSSQKKENEPNWLKRIIVTGIITTLLSVGGYYLKKKIDTKNGNVNSEVIATPNSQPLEGKKQTP